MNNKELLDKLSEHIHKGDKEGLKQLLTTIPSHELAAGLQYVEPEDRIRVLDCADPETASEVLLDMEPELREETIKQMDPDKIATIMGEMESDDAADLIAELPES